MAEISKSGTPSLCTVLPNDSNKLGSGLVAGEAIAAGDACYIKQADGKVWRSDGSTGGALGTTAEVDGFAATAAGVGRPVDLFHDVNFNYGAGLTPGMLVYLSTTVLGGLTDTVGTRQVKAVGRTVDATRIRLLRTY